MEEPLISFILTYYDLPVKMLCECIDSILALSLRNFEREIIIVDDGSGKSPINDLMKYEDHIIYIRQKNQGLSAARNTGIQMARGEFLQFIDGDDLLLQPPYEHCIDLIRFNHPEMVVFNFTHTGQEDKTYQDSQVQSGSDYMRNNNIRGTAWGYIFRRSILGDLRFTTGIIHEDEEFTPQLLLRAERIIVTDAEAYLYRLRPNSIITDSHIRKRLRRLHDTKGVISRLNTLADHLPINDKAALQRRVAQLTMDYLYQVMKIGHGNNMLDETIERLRAKGLFPLPDKGYTKKYSLFRMMTNSGAGRKFLQTVIS
jgi:glycosyltransferase involved in cell wall biosynthesis